MRFLRIDENSPYRQLIGVGGLGTGIFFALEGEHTLGRNESRPGRWLNVKDYCKLHIVIHYIAKILGSTRASFPVLPVGRVGNDQAGNFVISEMKDVGIDTRHVQALPDQPTLFSVCFQYPDGAGGNITTSNSAAETLSRADIDEVAPRMRDAGSRLIALAVPEVPLEIRRYFLQIATQTGAFRAASFVAAEVNSARDSKVFELLDLVALNENEAEVLAGQPFSPESPERLLEACQHLLRTSYPNLRLIVSAGELGAYGITAETSGFCPAPIVNVASTAGAGDSLLGGILAAMAAGIPFTAAQPASATVIASALQFGVLLASYKCLSPHTIHPQASLDALVDIARNLDMSFSPAIEELFVADSVA